MGLFDFVKDPAGEIADEVKEGTEVVLGNIGKIGVAAVEGAIVGTREAVKGREVKVITGITCAVFIFVGFHLLKTLVGPTNITKTYNP